MGFMVLAKRKQLAPPFPDSTLKTLIYSSLPQVAVSTIVAIVYFSSDVGPCLIAFNPIFNNSSYGIRMDDKVSDPGNMADPFAIANEHSARRCEDASSSTYTFSLAFVAIFFVVVFVIPFVGYDSHVAEVERARDAEAENAVDDDDAVSFNPTIKRRSTFEVSAGRSSSGRKSTSLVRSTSYTMNNVIAFDMSFKHQFIALSFMIAVLGGVFLFASKQGKVHCIFTFPVSPRVPTNVKLTFVSFSSQIYFPPTAFTVLIKRSFPSNPVTSGRP